MRSARNENRSCGDWQRQLQTWKHELLTFEIRAAKIAKTVHNELSAFPSLTVVPVSQTSIAKKPAWNRVKVSVGAASPRLESYQANLGFLPASLASPAAL